MEWSYKASCAACQGLYHREQGVPCQDKVAVHREGDVLCAALADGAGSRTSSDLGADCVTRHVAGLLCCQFDRLWELENQALTGLLLDSCLERLAQEEPPIYELASTLMFFAGHRDGRYLAGHLGDGIQILDQGGELRVFSPPENGEYRNETFFVTADDAAQHMRLLRGTWPEPGALLLMSDGMSASLYQQETGQPASGCRTLAEWLRQGGEAEIGQALLENMKRLFSRHSSDDLSLALLVWTPADENKEEIV